MTIEEFYSTPLYRLLKIYLTKKYPWIKDIIVSEEEYLTGYDLVSFFDLVIDPIMMNEMYGWEMPSHVANVRNSLYGGRYEGPMLRAFVTDEYKKEAEELSEEIKRKVRIIQRSEALPKEYKLDKTANPLSYIWDDNLTKQN